MLRVLSLLSILVFQGLSSIGLYSNKPAHEQSLLEGVEIQVVDKGESEKTEIDRLLS